VHNTFIIEFKWENSKITFAEIIEHAGYTPIPPYLNRASEPNDRVRYQTVYSRFDGSVAAPTAGLHFTESVMGDLKRRGVRMENLTLHVGAGTFTPVKENDASKHTMHSETVLIEKGFIENLLHNTGRIIAVGTTSTRSLESLFWLGVKAMHKELEPENISLSQWEVYGMEQKVSKKESLEKLLAFMNLHYLDHLHFQTGIMIVPGDNFRLVNGMITNFHQPKSTLLLLIAAFIGEKWKEVYDYALINGFRFLSYGDSSILFPSEG
jgi:S-adenosylmethionine:tRNA ribosyltransferase-isomerase